MNLTLSSISIGSIGSIGFINLHRSVHCMQLICDDLGNIIVPCQQLRVRLRHVRPDRAAHLLEPRRAGCKCAVQVVIACGLVVVTGWGWGWRLTRRLHVYKCTSLEPVTETA